MNVEMGSTEAAQFPEKKYINGIFVARWDIVSREEEVVKDGISKF
jgi:hypothetical protein